jgi:hypothetical protein
VAFERKHLFRIVVVIGVVLGASAAFRSILGRFQTPDDPMAVAMAAELDRQGLTAQFNAELAGITDTAEAHKFGAQLARRGVARLPEADLGVRERLLLHLDSIAGDTLCAGRFMGNLPPTEMRRYISLLDSARLARWVTVAVHAMKAELDATSPSMPPTSDEIAALLKTVTDSVPEADRSHFSAVFANVAGASIADQCWAGKMVSATALGLPSPLREDVLRKLAMVEAGS